MLPTTPKTKLRQVFLLLGALVAGPAGLAGAAPIDSPAPGPDSPGGHASGFIVTIADLVGPGLAAVISQQSQSGSTAADLRARREAKRGDLSAPQKGGVEAGLAWLEDGHWLQRIRTGWNGFLPTLGGFPSGSGQAFGVIWSKTGIGARYPNEFTPNRFDLRGSVAFSLRGYYLSLFEVAVHRIGGSPIHTNFHFGYQHNANESFYGFGMDTAVEDRISYSQTVSTAIPVVIEFFDPSQPTVVTAPVVRLLNGTAGGGTDVHHYVNTNSGSGWIVPILSNGRPYNLRCVTTKGAVSTVASFDVFYQYLPQV